MPCTLPGTVDLDPYSTLPTPSFYSDLEYLDSAPVARGAISVPASGQVMSDVHLHCVHLAESTWQPQAAFPSLTHVLLQLLAPQARATNEVRLY